VWAAVERACEREDFRPNPARLCDWCAFKAYCPSFGGDIALADAHRQQQLELV
jgi:RecB family exonuclease